MRTCAKFLAFPPTTRLYHQYRAAQAQRHPACLHPRNLHQSCPMANAKPLMRIAPQRPNPTTKSSNAQSQTRRRRLPARHSRMRLPLRCHTPVRLPPTFPSYPLKASCPQKCQPRRKWRVYFLSCVNACWSKSILEISLSSCTVCHHCHQLQNRTAFQTRA
jgi:hypothetical protein